MKFSFLKKREKPRIHLDYASTTPVHPEILERMQPYFRHAWANPSAIYKEGVAVKKVITDMRLKLARTLRVRAEDITFTSGGTESNNLALVGYIEALRTAGRSYGDMHIVSTKIEHPSVLETLKYLEARGVIVSYAPVSPEGLIDTQALEATIQEQSVLVTFSYANSEIGVVQDVKKITRMIRKHNEMRSDEHKILTHLDASQAPLWLPCALDMLGVDMMTLDAGKCYGPKGVGVLAHRAWVHLSPILFGGGQESGLRSGTENVALIVGCVEAVVRAQEDYEARSLAVAKLRDHLITQLEREIQHVVVNGSRTSRIANNVNISIPGLDTEYATIWLDARGVAVATKSACGTAKGSGSHVVREMTHDDTRAHSTLRFTFGEESKESDIKNVVALLKKHIELMKGNIN